MDNIIILGILAVAVAVGILSTVKHFQGKSSCCGGGGSYIPKKKLKKVIATKTYHVEGMTCENCAARVLRYVNDIPGAAGKIDLRKKRLTVSMERDIPDGEIIAAVTKAGYQVQ